MELSNIPQDDMIDVAEMSNKIETYICSILKDNDPNIAMSALISSTVNCIMTQCKTLDEIMLTRRILLHALDSSIRNIRIQGPEKPPTS